MTDITQDEEYRKLVDKFYQEHRKFVSEKQYDRAKRDAAYFRALMQEMIELYQKIGRELFLKDRNHKRSGTAL